MNQTEVKFRSELSELSEYIVFLTPHRHFENHFLKEIFIHSRKKDTIIIGYQSKNQQSVKKVIPIGLYTSKGLWYVLAYDVKKDTIITLRVDRISDMVFEHSNLESLHLPTLKEWLTNQENEKGYDSTIQFHVELTREGVMKCRDNEFLEQHIHEHDNGTGYVEVVVPETDLNHVTEYFFTLHQDAKIIRPKEAINRMCEMATAILAQYKG